MFAAVNLCYFCCKPGMKGGLAFLTLVLKLQPYSNVISVCKVQYVSEEWCPSSDLIH